jgi:hypothetical protein
MGFQVDNFDSFIKDGRIKPELANDFRESISELEEKVSSLSSSVEVMDIKSTLGKLQDKISEEGDEIKELVSRVILAASDHLNEIYDKKRHEALEKIPNVIVSLVGISLDRLENSLLGFMLENADENDTSITEYSLKDLCGKVIGISNQQLPESIEIAEKLIESLKDEDEIENFIKFCSGNSSRVQSLFSIMHYLGLDEFQNDHFEPFNKKFPNIHLEQAPKTIRQLDLSGKNIEGVDLSRFEFLEILDLSDAKGLTTQLNTIPNKASIRTLNLSNVDVTHFNFPTLTGLKKLVCNGSLTAAQFNAIPAEVRASIEHLELNKVGSVGFNFSGFTNLKTLISTDSLESSTLTGISAAQFNSIPNKASIEHLDLSYGGMSEFNFSDLEKIKNLNLNNSSGLTEEQFDSIPNKASVESLDLGYTNITGFDFSEFTKLKKIELVDTDDLTDFQINSFSEGVEIITTDISLNGGFI